MAFYSLYLDGELAIGTDGDDTFVSYADNTRVQGRAGNDILKGRTGSVLRGQAGDDILEIEGTGGGIMRGGIGGDTYNILSSNDGVSGLVIDELGDSGDGDDTVRSNIDFSLNTGTPGITILGAVENLFLNVLPLGTGPVFAEGNNLANTIVGNRENNTLLGLGGDDRMFGSFGSDTISGGDGNDFIEGNEDNDVIDGGAGNDNLFGDKLGVTYASDDILNGGAGNDTMEGGLGADTFQFGGAGLVTQRFTATSIGTDVISDFNSGEGDVIEINTLTFNATDLVNAIGGDLSTVTNGFISGNFGVDDLGLVGGNRLLQTNAYFVYNLDNGNLYYNPNLGDSGSGGGGLFATLTGIPTLTAADITLV